MANSEHYHILVSSTLEYKSSLLSPPPKKKHTPVNTTYFLHWDGPSVAQHMKVPYFNSYSSEVVRWIHAREEGRSIFAPAWPTQSAAPCMSY